MARTRPHKLSGGSAYAKWGIYTCREALLYSTRTLPRWEVYSYLPANALTEEGLPTRTGGAAISTPALSGYNTAILHVVLWTLGFALALALCLHWDTGVKNDFTQNVWLPSRLVLDWVNPYHPARSQVDTALGVYSSDFPTFNNGTASYYFIYPMWVALALAPFGAMPLLLATAVWRAANMVLLVWSVASVLRSSNLWFRLGRPAALASLLFVLFLVMLFRETFVTLYHGQFSIIELGLLAAVWRWLMLHGGLSSSTPDMPEQGKTGLYIDLPIGLALALLATKPQATGLAVVLVCLWAISRRRWAIPVSAAAAFLTLLLVPALFYPGSFGDWFGTVLGKGQAASQSRVSASVWGLSYQWLGASSPWVMVAALLSIAGVVALVPRWLNDFKDKRSPVPLSLPLTLCINSVISPYMLQYEHMVLLLPALVLLASTTLPAGEKSQGEASTVKYARLAVYGWLAILPFLVVSMQTFVDKEYVVIVQSATLLLMCWAWLPKVETLELRTNLVGSA